MPDREVTIKISAKNLTEAEFRKVRSGLAGIGKGAGGAKKKTTGLQKAFASFGRAAPGALKAVTVGAAALAGAVVGIAATIVKLGERGAVVGDVKEAFDKLSVAAGETGAVMLGALQQGVKGTVSNFELMKVANKALGAGLLDSADDARTMAEGARLLAKRTGGDTTQAFETMITSIASGRTAQLKQIGLFVDNKQAVEDYAKATGKSVSQMNDADRATALQAATLAALRVELESNAPPLADFGELIEQGKVAIKNLVDGLALMISTSPPLIAAMHTVREMIGDAFGGDQSGLVLTIVNWIEKAALMAIEFGKAGITAAGFIYRAFSGIKLIVMGIAIAITDLGVSQANLVASTLELAAKIPGLGGAFEGAAGFARSAATALEGVNTGLKDGMRDALAAAAGVDAFGQGVQTATGVLDTIKTSMVNAGLSQRELNAATAEGTTAITTHAAASVAAGETIKLSTQEWGEKFLENLLATKEATAQWTLDEQQFFRDLAGPAGVGAFSFSVASVGGLVSATAAQMTADFAMFGMTTRADYEETVKALEESYDRILKSGKATAEELAEIWEILQKKKQEQAEKSEEFQLTSNQAIMEGSKQVLQALGTKYKGAAIAAAVISMYQAIAKALASAPWPASLVLAAGAAAAGAIQIAAIKRSKPYRAGTMGLDYQDFGTSTPAVLHGKEAVIPQGGGHRLAEEISGALARRNGGPRDTDIIADRFERIGSKLDTLPRAIQRAVRDGMLLAATT